MNSAFDIYLLNRKLEKAVLNLMDGNKSAAHEWFHRPLEYLNVDTPTQHSKSIEGCQMVLDLVGQLGYGEFP